MAYRCKNQLILDYEGDYVDDWEKEQKKLTETAGEGKRYSIKCFSEKDLQAKEEFFKLMLCSYCQVVCPPVHVQICVAGHLICENCSKLVQICPFEVTCTNTSMVFTCMKGYSPSRLPMYEFLYRTIEPTFRCDYHAKGCSMVLKSSDVKAHRIHCEYRPNIGCSYTDCRVGEMHFAEFIMHLLDKHETELVENNSEPVSVSFKMAPQGFEDDYSWTPAIFLFSDYYFLMTMLQQNGKLYMWFYRYETNGRTKKAHGRERILEMKIYGNDKETIYKRESHPRNFHLTSSVITKQTDVCKWDLKNFIRDYVEGEGAARKMTVAVNIAYNMIYK